MLLKFGSNFLLKYCKDSIIMSNLDLQFEEFMKEALSTDESPDTNSSQKHETNEKESLSTPRKLWWMKDRFQTEKITTGTASLRSSFSGASGDSPQIEGGNATISPTMRNIELGKAPVTASPDVSSSMAEFLEKEKLCKDLSNSISEVDSPGMDLEFPGGDVTDDDIGSIMEQLSQLAGSGDDSAADKSMEEILKEAEDLVRETSRSFSRLSDSSDLLKEPITPDPVIRSMSVNLTPTSTTSKKTDDKHFVTEEKVKDARTSSNSTKASAIPKTSRKTDSKSPSRGLRGKGGQFIGNKAGTSRTTSRKTISRLGLEESSGNKLGDSRLVTYSDTDHQNIGARTDNESTKVGNVISVTNSAKSLGDIARNYSGSKSKCKDSSKKERTVTFEDGLPLFSKSTDSVSRKPKGAVQASSQEENISKESSDEILTKDDDLYPLERVTPQANIGDGLSTRESIYGGQLTEVLSISPPLIKHGDMVGTPEAIFQLIDDEVRNEIVIALQESKQGSSPDPKHSSLHMKKEMEKIISNDDNAGSTIAESLGSVGFLFPRKPLSVVLEESSISESSLGVDTLKDAITMTEHLHGKESIDRAIQVTDNSVTEQLTSLEMDLLQERNTSLQLKAKLKSEEQECRKKLDALKCKHEEEMFTLKKDVYVLNAKIADLEKQQDSIVVEEGGGDCRIDGSTVREHRITLLEAELQQQEQLMLGYQRENIKLCQDMKQLREEVKVREQSFTKERQQLSSARQGQQIERLAERLKDKAEAIVRLKIEVQDLRDKNGNLERSAQELKLSNTALQAEVEKHKCAKSKTVAPPSKTTSRNQELEHIKKELAKREVELEEKRKELQSSRREVVTTKAEVNESQLQVGALETKVLELQTSLTKERGQTRAHDLKIEEDKKIIQDLNRQVKEMERILKRNHPNSISALILTANSEGTDSAAAPTPRLKYLENRVQQLEQEVAKNETDAQDSMKEIQDKFQAMKVKYEEHTSDLELQLATAKHQAHMWRQAAEKNEAMLAQEKKVEEQLIWEAKQSKKTAAPPMVITVGAPSANALAVREDAHLLATIRGLKLELAAKDKELVKIRRDLDESAKTNRRLQRERERQLGVVTAPPRPPTVRGATKEQQLNEKNLRSSRKMYDPTRFEPSPPNQDEGAKRLEDLNSMLRQELLRLEEDYNGLQTKRLQDLNLLQEQHEAEMDRLVSDHVARHSSSRIADFQGQLCTQQIVIGHLKDQLKQLDEYREETEMLKAERDHLEKSNMDLRKKVADLRSMQTPEMIQYEALQEKLSELEYRHETREQNLQSMVRDLLRRNAEQRTLNVEDSNGTTMKEKLLEKNRQLCFYRAEIDRILETLREFYRHKKPGSTVQLAPD